MAKSLTIFLSVLVFIANAYCACAKASAQLPQPDMTVEPPVPSHSGCHGHPAAPDGQGQGGQGDHDSHSCGHCTGTVSADSSQGKVMPPALLLSPMLFAALPTDIVAAGAMRGSCCDHSGLPPPLPPPTLLNLGCSLTI